MQKWTVWPKTLKPKVAWDREYDKVSQFNYLPPLTLLLLQWHQTLPWSFLPNKFPPERKKKIHIRNITWNLMIYELHQHQLRYLSNFKSPFNFTDSGFLLILSLLELLKRGQMSDITYTILGWQCIANFIFKDLYKSKAGIKNEYAKWYTVTCLEEIKYHIMPESIHPCKKERESSEFNLSLLVPSQLTHVKTIKTR